MKGYSKTTVSVAALLLTGMLALSTDQARAQSVADQLGACKNEAGALQARITACGRVIKDTDDDEMRGEALIQRGVLFEQSDNKEAAIKDYTDAIKLDPSSAVAFFNRGNAYDQLGDYDRAIADYTEAIKLDPNDPTSTSIAVSPTTTRASSIWPSPTTPRPSASIRKTLAPTTIAAWRAATRATSSARSPISTRPSSLPHAMPRLTRAGRMPTRNSATTLPPKPTTSGLCSSIRTTRMPRKGWNALRTEPR
jgi:tetratricopeptide (TPR) repeat protein